MKILAISLLLISITAVGIKSPQNTPLVGTIEGTVLIQGTTTPLVGATLGLSISTDRNRAVGSARVLENGSFKINDVKPNEYVISVRGVPEGYVVPFPSGAAAITLRAGDSIKNVVLYARRAGVITGRVLDENGKPFLNVRVEALTKTYDYGRLMWQVATRATTDDHGEYRLFWLDPGTNYYIRAFATGAPSLGTPSARTYFPGTVSPMEAQAILATEDKQPVRDFLFHKSEFVRITGRIVNLLPNPSPTAPIGIILMPRELRGPVENGTTYLSSRTPFVADPEQFQMEIPIGSYDLFPWVLEGQVRRLSRIRLETGQEGVANVIASITPGVTLKGGITFQGKPPAVPLTSAQVQLFPHDNLPITQAFPIDPDGSFTISVPNSTYSINISGLPPDAYVGDIQIGSRSIIDSGITVDGFSGSETISAFIKSDGAVVEGMIDKSSQTSPLYGTVALVPEQSHRGRISAYRVANTDWLGRFTIRGVAPGNYKVFAWPKIPGQAYENEDVLAHFDSRGIPVTVAPAAHLTVKVPIILDPFP